jgi:signal transduction histidine kinase
MMNNAMSATNILVVEDESIIALDIKNSLKKSGYTVVGMATSAEEALKKINDSHPDLVLMDIQLRGAMDGVETAEQIRSQFQIPVVYLTAHADEYTLQRAKVTQPFGYVLKPFEDKELTTTIEIALSRHQAEKAIRQALLKEKELSELKSRFVSVVSHEFRNPLSTILFSTELLERYDGRLLPEKRLAYLSRIRESVNRMNYLLTDVLTIGEVEAGSLRFNPNQLDIEKFCTDLVEEFCFKSEGHHTILFTSTGECPNVLPNVDEKLLRHILSNLLSNAVKYSPNGGCIDLKLEYKPGQIMLQVCDQGIGIPVADQPKLFDSFHRANNVNQIPGTGLGLSIVKQCVELHGGSIMVASEVGVGTTFTVSLPFVTETITPHF